MDGASALMTRGAWLLAWVMLPAAMAQAETSGRENVIFAYAQAVRINISVNIPEQFLQMLPYVLTLLVLVLMGLRNSKKIKDSVL